MVGSLWLISLSLFVLVSTNISKTLRRGNSDEKDIINSYIKTVGELRVRHGRSRCWVIFVSFGELCVEKVEHNFNEANEQNSLRTLPLNELSKTFAYSPHCSLGDKRCAVIEVAHCIFSHVKCHFSSEPYESAMQKYIKMLLL